MNINRNNYEEYFLLYADNELSVAEKNMVDAFVAANPDLGEELLMLQQSILKPDIVEFPGKEILVRPQPVDAVIEEKLLLLLDNELPENEKKEMLQLTTTDKAVKEEWDLLQQTKLAAIDKIIFENKPLLYRKETKVVAFPWRRVAAAAILIGFGLWGTVSYLNRNEQNATGAETVKNTSPGKELNTGKEATTNTAAENINSNETAVASSQQEISTQLLKEDKQTAVKSAVISNTNSQQTILTQDNSDNIAANDEQQKNDEEEKNFNNEESNKKIFAYVSPEINDTKTENNVDITPASKNEFVEYASLNNPEKQSFDSFDEEEDKPKKTKLGGFFKKVKRLIERKTKIKTGSGDEVKIANMSFAMN